MDCRCGCGNSERDVSWLWTLAYAELWMRSDSLGDAESNAAQEAIELAHPAPTTVGLPPGRYEPPTQEQLDRHRRIMAYVITRFR